MAPTTPLRPIVGLMMSKDEEDFIEQTLSYWRRRDIPIFAIDDSSDRTFEILRSFDNVTAFRQEQFFPRREKGCLHWIYQPLLDEKRRRYGADTWVFLTLADEIWYHDPFKIVCAMEEEGAALLKMRSCHHLLHPGDRAKWDFVNDSWLPEYAALPITERLPYYTGDWFEYRGYLDREEFHYEDGQESILPVNITGSFFSRTPILQHHSVRTPTQVVARAKDRVERDFQRAYEPHYYQKDPGDVFYAEYTVWDIKLRRFTGTYEEYEVGLEDLKPD
jgi:hypothetical protein